MQFFSKVKQELTQSGVPHTDKIRAYCQKRIEQVIEALPYLEAYPSRGKGIDENPLTKAQKQRELLTAIIEQLDGKESEITKRANIRHLASLHGVAPFGRDIVAILEGREQELPEQLRDIPKFLQQERAKAEAERIRRGIERRAELEKQRLRREEDQKRARREQFAGEIGVSPEALQKLATS